MNWTIRVLGFDFRRGLGIFLFTTASRTALGPTQPPIQGVPGALSLGLKRPVVKLTIHLHLVPMSKNEWSYTSTHQIRLDYIYLVPKNAKKELCPVKVEEQAQPM
jgi:hypothetical protein